MAGEGDVVTGPGLDKASEVLTGEMKGLFHCLSLSMGRVNNSGFRIQSSGSSFHSMIDQ